jgi:DNA-binding NarL/FixJ family response regulator
MTRVLICDDHPVVRQGLVALLGTLEGFDVVAVTTNGRDALKEAVLQKPDVVLMDLQMPGGDGFEALRQLAKAAPDVAVCVLTMFDDDDSLFAAMRAGARGYLLKGAEQEDIARAVRGIAAGEVVFGPGVAQRVLGQLTAPAAPTTLPFPELTPREREILHLLAAGVPGASIARQLDLAPKTVSNNISNILAKLHLSDRTQAAVAAREAGLGR